MASLARGNTDDVRRAAISPRPKGRENVKETLCRNVTIYGHCRYENKGCSFNHDPTRGNNSAENMKKRFNVDSPSFTPASVQSSPSLSVNGVNAKAAGISPKAANAAPFKPKVYNGGGTDQAAFSRNQYNPAAADWSMTPGTEVSEFLPPSQGLSQNVVNTDAGMAPEMYNTFSGTMQTMGDTQINNQQTMLGAFSADGQQNISQSFFPGNTMDQQPTPYHLYSSFGPRRENLQPHQRVAQDFFIPDDLREYLQKKSEDANKALNTGIGLLQIPGQVYSMYHSLVALEPYSTKKSTESFGFASSVYKVTANNGLHYALRRIEGWVSTNFDPWKNGTVDRWKSLSCASIVPIVDAFPNRTWTDRASSLIVVSEYHPLSKTLAQEYAPISQGRGRDKFPTPDSQTMWSYITQMANALRAIHAENLAARIIKTSKVLVTDKNRIRFNASGLLDMLWPDQTRPIAELQREDLANFGRMILQLGVGPQLAQNPNVHILLEHFKTRYPNALTDRVAWLINSPVPGQPKTIDTFMSFCQPYLMINYNASLNATDEAMNVLQRELENARLVRLMVKFSMILERDLPVGNNQQWSETGDRYPIKLFRDYVFHQVDENGLPVANLAWIVTCLNKLDAASPEKITLTTRDEQTSIIVTYKEMKQALEAAYRELSDPGQRRQGY